MLNNENKMLLCEAEARWCPLPGSLIFIKGPQHFKKNKFGNCWPVNSSKKSFDNWCWMPEAAKKKPVLFLKMINPWSMRILSSRGLFDTSIENFLYVLEK